jgi:tRNA G46 methylase TrmB
MYLAELMSTKWISFGLKAAFSQLQTDLAIEDAELLSSRNCNDIIKKVCQRHLTTIDQDGCVAFPNLFTPHTKKGTKRPLDMELGSGFGDWAVFQAKSKPRARFRCQWSFVLIELLKLLLGSVLSEMQLPNLSCVGAECGSFLKLRVRNASVCNNIRQPS